MSNKQVRAERIAKYFCKGDDYISEHERVFDNCWEQGDGDKVAQCFKVIYDNDAYLQRRCELSRYFSPKMISIKE